MADTQDTQTKAPKDEGTITDDAAFMAASEQAEEHAKAYVDHDIKSADALRLLAASLIRMRATITYMGRPDLQGDSQRARNAATNIYNAAVEDLKGDSSKDLEHKNNEAAKRMRDKITVNVRKYTTPAVRDYLAQQHKGDARKVNADLKVLGVKTVKQEQDAAKVAEANRKDAQTRATLARTQSRALDVVKSEAKDDGSRKGENENTVPNACDAITAQAKSVEDACTGIGENLAALATYLDDNGDTLSDSEKATLGRARGHLEAVTLEIARAQASLTELAPVAESVNENEEATA